VTAQTKLKQMLTQIDYRLRLSSLTNFGAAPMRRAGSAEFNTSVASAFGIAITKNAPSCDLQKTKTA
jgi:hypothetical protein